MKARPGRLAAVLAFGTLVAIPAVPAAAEVCGGLLSTQCAQNSYFLGHTHFCSTSGSTRTCSVHWHGTGTCRDNGYTGGVCTVVLNAGSDGYKTGSCSYAAQSSCTISLSTAAKNVSFPVGTTAQSCGTLTTTADATVFGTASDYSGLYCFSMS